MSNSLTLSRTFFVLFLVFTLSTAAWTQAPFIQWKASIGGSDGDVATTVQATPDGGYMVGGFSTSTDGDASAGPGNSDYWLVKLTGAGNIQWENKFGGTSGDLAYASAIAADGGYVIAGYTLSTDGDVSGTHGNRDAWVIKVSNGGSLLWQKALGGSEADHANAVVATADGGFIVAGRTLSSDGDILENKGGDDAWLIKLDGNGNIVWQQTYGGSGNDVANAIITTPDGGYVFTGYTDSNNGDVTVNHGSYDVWVVKINGTGTIQWQSVLGGTSYEFGRSIIPAAGGGYIVAGQTFSNNGDVSGNHGSDDFWMLKINETGVLQWQRTYGGTSTDAAYTVSAASDGGYLLGGRTNSVNGNVTGNHGGTDYWLVKTDNTGNMQWQKTYGGSASDNLFAALTLSGDQYIVVGESQSTDGDVTGNHGAGDFWILELGPTEGLPVTFGEIKAWANGDQWKVQWETLNETNCSHFDVEASLDGTNFHKIGTINSKSTNGNANHLLQYELIATAHTFAAASLGILCLLAGFSKKRRLALLMSTIFLLSFVACNKSGNGVIDKEGKVFIRIAQVDKDNTLHYSRTVVVVKQ